jgi:putative spermidine/putrescine transport system substrate-binding protein
MKIKKIIGAMMVLALVFALTACQQGTEPVEPPEGPQTSGPSGQVVVATWGGTFQELLQECVEPVLAEMAPDVEVLYLTGQDYEHIAKALAEKDGPGSFDLVMLGEIDVPKMTNNDLAMPLNEENIPNIKFVIPEFKNEYFIPQIFSGGVLAYNENHVTPAPDSWSAMWDPKYKGKIGIIETGRHFALFMSSIIKGQEYAYGNDWEAGWDGLMELKETMEPKIYATQEQLGNAMMTGEIWMTFGWRARASQWNTAEGEPVANVVPKEGTYPYLSGACMLKNAPNPDAAFAFLNALLDPRAQEGFAKNMGYAPTITNCELPSELSETIGFDDDEISRVKAVDPNYIAENDASWKNKWDREFIAE